MDLVCLIDNKEAALHASDLVAMIGDLLERGENSLLETKNYTSRIPTAPTIPQIDPFVRLFVRFRITHRNQL
jgi:hypothetical protein